MMTFEKKIASEIASKIKADERRNIDRGKRDKWNWLAGEAFRLWGSSWSILIDIENPEQTVNQVWCDEMVDVVKSVYQHYMQKADELGLQPGQGKAAFVKLYPVPVRRKDPKFVNVHYVNVEVFRECDVEETDKVVFERLWKAYDAKSGVDTWDPKYLNRV